MSKKIEIEIDEEVFNDSNNLFAELGLDIETAINMFLKKSIRTKSIPFDISMDNQTYDIEKKEFTQEEMDVMTILENFDI